MADYTFTTSVDGNDCTITGINPSTYRGDVVIPEIIGGKTVTSIGDGAFRNSSITNVVIPDTAWDIRSYAFRDCTSLESVTIPGSVTLIDEGAFMGCTSLKNVSILSDFLYSLSIFEYAFEGCTNLRNFVTPAGRSCNIYERAFANSGLEDIVILGTLPFIDRATFESCHNLKSVKLDDETSDISEAAFYNCTSLKTITLPSSISYILSSAFYGCSNLGSIYFKHSSTDALGIAPGSLRTGRTSITVMVPDANNINPAISGYDWAGDGYTNVVFKTRFENTMRASIFEAFEKMWGNLYKTFAHKNHTHGGDYAPISHVLSTSNPHDVTAAQIGAATKPKLGQVTLLASAWTGTGPYAQTITHANIGANTQVNIEANNALLNQMEADGVMSVFVENNNGTATVYARGGKFASDVVVNLTFIEIGV